MKQIDEDILFDLLPEEEEELREKEKKINRSLDRRELEKRLESLEEEDDGDISDQW